MSRFDCGLAFQVEEGKFVEAQMEAHFSRFAWSKGDAQKSLEASDRLLNACPQVAHVALSNFCCGSAAGVAHNRRRIEERCSSFRERLRQRDAALRYMNVRVGEAGVGESVPERKLRAVGDINIAGEEARAVTWRF